MASAYTIKSHTDPTVSYTVTFPDTGEPYCTCKGYGYRRTCSHIKEAQTLMDIEIACRTQASHPLLQNYCATCNAPLTGTHAMLDKCANCYRQEAFSHV